VSTNGLFRTTMPRLSKLATKGIDKKVKDGDKSHPHVRAFLDYPGGDLKVLNTFEQPFRYELKDQDPVTLCVPRTVQLVVPGTPSKVVMLITNKDNDTTRIYLKPDVQITISNVALGSRHFHEYKNLLEAGGVLADEEDVDDARCDTMTGEVQKLSGPMPSVVATTAERDGSASVRRFIVPRGDCGNTAWP